MKQTTLVHYNITLKCYRNEAQFLQCIFLIKMWQKNFPFQCFPQQIMLTFRLLDKLHEVKYHIYHSKRNQMKSEKEKKLKLS